MELGARFAGSHVDVERRLDLGRWISGLAAGDAAVLALCGAWGVTAGAIEITESAFFCLGCRAGSWATGLLKSGTYLEDIVQRVNALEPDLIAVTGDLVDGSVEQLGAHVDRSRSSKRATAHSS